MKSNFKVILLALGAGTLLWAGCKTQTPLTGPSALSVSTDLFVITSTTFSGNPKLPLVTAANAGQPLGTTTLGAGTYLGGLRSYPVPIQVIATPVVINGLTYTPGSGPVQPTDGGNGVPAFCCSSVVPSGLPQFPYAIQINSWIDDPECSCEQPGTSNYDSEDLENFPNYSGTTGPIYNVSPFAGIQFYINVAAVDSAPVKQFHVFTTQTEKPTLGDCLQPAAPFLTDCTDDFYYDYSAIPRGQWVFVQERWTNMKQNGYGSTPNPPTLSGAELEQVTGFLWEEGNSAIAGPVTINFEVTGAQFF
jgi:hypothetical protein